MQALLTLSWHGFRFLLQVSTLFNIAPTFPEGFSYFPDFISGEEETSLLESIRGLELQTFTFQGYAARRRTASFGYDYSFERKSLSTGRRIPGEFDALIQKTALHTGLPPEAFAELLVTEYPPGSVINWHRDAPPFDLIAGISLLGDCIFRLRPYEKEKRGRPTVISFPVERRSLYIIQGPAREHWQHSIAPVQASRYSITLRNLKK